MINKKQHLMFLFVTILLCNYLYSNNLKYDTLTIKIFGNFKKNQKFILKYNNDKICSFGGFNKVVTVKIPFDSTNYSNYCHINLCIFKKSNWNNKFKRLQYPFIYYPGMKYVIIYYIPYITKGFLIYSLPYFKHVIVIDDFDKIF